MNTSKEAGAIYLKVDETNATTLEREGYVFPVDSKNVVVVAASGAGVFYAIQSIRQLIQNKIPGVNTQMWGEWIRMVKRMNFLLYPRITAIAETGWTDSTQKDYKKIS